MNDNNGRRQQRGARSRDERTQNRPADYADRPRRSGGKHKNGKLLYYGVLVLLLSVLVFSSVKIISYVAEKKSSEKNQQELIDQMPEIFQMIQTEYRLPPSGSSAVM